MGFSGIYFRDLRGGRQYCKIHDITVTGIISREWSGYFMGGWSIHLRDDGVERRIYFIDTKSIDFLNT